jgi:hypothetical protein
MSGFQKIGGVAALTAAATFLIAFAVFFGVLIPAGYFDEGVTPAAQTRIIVENQAAASISWLIPYVGFGLAQVVLSLALYHRLKAGAPSLAQTATAVGLIWAGLVIAGGFVASLGIRTVVDLYATDPAQAATLWIPFQTVASALSGGAGEVLGGVWLLLIGWAALRARGLPKAVSFVAIALGVVGALTVIPPLEPAAVVYGLGLIVWWMWLGVVMLRASDRPASGPVAQGAAIT